jgi:hypothetical protein
VVARHVEDHAGAALAFGASFFRSGETAVAKNIQQSSLSAGITDRNGLPVQQKLK